MHVHQVVESPFSFRPVTSVKAYRENPSPGSRRAVAIASLKRTSPGWAPNGLTGVESPTCVRSRLRFATGCGKSSRRSGRLPESAKGRCSSAPAGESSRPGASCFLRKQGARDERSMAFSGVSRGAFEAVGRGVSGLRPAQSSDRADCSIPSPSEWPLTSGCIDIRISVTSTNRTSAACCAGDRRLPVIILTN